MRLRAATHLRAAALVMLIHTSIDIFLDSPMAEEWDENSPFYKALISTTHSLSQVSLHSAWKGSRYDYSLHLHSITVIFSSPSHPLPYFTYYVALMYYHTSSGSGVHRAWFLIFGYFLSLLSKIASANVHEHRHDWSQFLHPTLGAMGKTTSKPSGWLAHQLFTMGGSPWLHTNCLMLALLKTLLH